MDRGRRAGLRLLGEDVTVQVRQKPVPEQLLALVERVVERDERHAAAVELLVAEAHDRGLVAQHLAVVAAERLDVRGALPPCALLDQTQRRALDVEQVQPAAARRSRMRNCGSLLDPIDSPVNGRSRGVALPRVRSTRARAWAMSTLSLLCLDQILSCRYICPPAARRPSVRRSSGERVGAAWDTIAFR